MQGRGVADHSHARMLTPAQASGLWPQWFKRPADLIVAIPLLAGLAPVMAVIVLMIRLDSPGPAVYVQRRLGRNGRPFPMWKFRSMYVGSDHASHRRAAANWFAGVPTTDGYKLRNDARVTRIGRFLRRTSLDELPQLFNVVRGDMSLVGPRPAIAYELDHYADWHYERFAVRPGVTGLWQVTGRDWVPATEMMRMDCQYVRRCSLWTDLKILALTVPSLLGLSLSRRARMGRD